jgi:hypothetical protein
VDEHIQQCLNKATELHAQLNADLGRAIECVSIQDHYADGVSRQSLPAALEIGRRKFLFATGKEAHFISWNEGFEKCTFHGLSETAPTSQFVDELPAGPNENLRTFQTAGSIRCCASNRVRNIKSMEFTPTTPVESTIKSDREESVFCKILQVETYLCCKACTFNSICAGYAGPLSPCVRDV